MADRFLFMMSRIQHRITGHIKRALKKEGIMLSPGQLGILLALEKEQQTVMGALSRILEMDNAALTRLVARMEKQGLVAREINPENRRQILVRIRKKGMARALVVKRIAHGANDKIREGFTDAEMEVYKRVNQSILEKFR